MEGLFCVHCGKKAVKSVRDKDGAVVPLCAECYEQLYGRHCPFCGTTVEEFKKSGLLGCSKCYTTLFDEILPVIKNVQGNLRHTGKTPVNYADEAVKEDIERAMREGDFSRANRLKETLRRKKTEREEE